MPRTPAARVVPRAPPRRRELPRTCGATRRRPAPSQPERRSYDSHLELEFFDELRRHRLCVALEQLGLLRLLGHVHALEHGDSLRNSAEIANFYAADLFRLRLLDSHQR